MFYLLLFVGFLFFKKGEILMTTQIRYSFGAAAGKLACEVDIERKLLITQLKGVRIYISMVTYEVVKEEIIQ